MLVDKNFLALLYLGNKQRRIVGAKPTALPRMNSALGRLSSSAKNRTAGKTKELISMLLSHGARATRASKPRASTAMNVYLPDGRRAVRIKMATYH
ncbi:MAG: hypothetical protein L3J32_08475 [Rhizobiaceae bacterium]|nr:hypothetical protein [Rhizobiaceae bacterium]